MTDANATATAVQIDTDAHETMTGTRGHDHVAEVQVGGGNHEHDGRVQSIRHTVAQNHLRLNEMGMVRDTIHALTGATVAGMVAGVQTISRGVYSYRAFESNSIS